MINKSWQKKQNHRQNQELLQCIFCSHILWTCNYIYYLSYLYIAHTETHTHTHTHTYTHTHTFGINLYNLELPY